MMMDYSYCSRSGVCANTKCPRWLNIDQAASAGHRITMADFKTDDCGYTPKPAYDSLRGIFKGEQE